MTIRETMRGSLDMLKPMNAIAAVAVTAALALPTAGMAQAPGTTKVGTLTCDVSAGIGLIIASKKDITCMFTPSTPGPREGHGETELRDAAEIGLTPPPPGPDATGGED